MTDKVQKIREEVEKLKSQLLRGACFSQIAMETICKEEAYDEVIAILDTMQEEPVSKDLEKAAANSYYHHHAFAIEAFIEGANWQKKQDDHPLTIAHMAGVEEGKDLMKQGEQKPAENGEPILTEFEAELYTTFSDIWQGYMLGKEINVAEVVKEHSAELLEAANKQKLAEWGDENEDVRNELIRYFESLTQCLSTEERHKENRRWLNWLKSLSFQNLWKPNEEQLYWLKWSVHRLPDTEKANEAEAVLEELLEQLKKLKG